MPSALLSEGRVLTRASLGKYPWDGWVVLRRIGILGSLLLLTSALLSCGKSKDPQKPSTSALSNFTAPSGPAAAPTGVMVGAGDIGMCGTGGADATARLLDSVGGTVFTTGDNAYMRCTAA